ncbi:MAG TPA: hypothetical protein VFV67_22130 [Actinophytocola sp.]|nr:hypothetical protein [Actinophytocola sp.]
MLFAACTAARIGELSGCRAQDVDTTAWTWTVRRQTTPSPATWSTRASGPGLCR